VSTYFQSLCGDGITRRLVEEERGGRGTERREKERDSERAAAVEDFPITEMVAGESRRQACRRGNLYSF